MKKNLDTLVGDIYELFEGKENHFPEDNNIRLL